MINPIGEGAKAVWGYYLNEHPKARLSENQESP